MSLRDVEDAAEDQLLDESPEESYRDRQARRLSTVTPWVLIVGGVLGFVSAFALTLDKIRVLMDPSYSPSCNINPVLSCGSVIITDQASVFGFPNPLMGLAGFSVVITLGVLLVSRVQLPRWVWLGLNVGALLGFAFCHWLIYQSLYSIGALCPWCMVVWTATAAIFVYVTTANIATGRLPLPVGFASAIVQLRLFILFGWYLVVLGLIFIRWQSFWLGQV